MSVSICDNTNLHKYWGSGIFFFIFAMMPTYSSELMKWEVFFNIHGLWGKTITLSHRSLLLSKHPRPFWVTFSLAHPKYHIWVLKFCCCSVIHSCLTLHPHGLQHARLPCPSLFPRVCSSSCLLSRWCHPTISSSVTRFSYLQSFPASGSFPMSQCFA